MTETYSPDGYIERRQNDGREQFFAQINYPGGMWYGELRDTREEAKADGRAECDRSGVRVPCFYTTAAEEEALRQRFGL